MREICFALVFAGTGDQIEEDMVSMMRYLCNPGEAWELRGARWELCGDRSSPTGADCCSVVADCSGAGTQS